MRNNKAFTLIELLAVIIILAIVALIATPIVLDVVDDARTSAAKSETAMIVNGINNYCATSEMKAQLNNTQSECIAVTKEDVSRMVDLGNAKVLELTYDKKIAYLKVESNTKIVEYDGREYKIDGEVVETPEPVEPQATVYYEFGIPTTSSSIDYQSVMTSSGSKTFAKLEGEQYSLCIDNNGTLECFKNNNYEEENDHLQNVIGVDNCELESDYTACYNDTVGCDVYTNGYVSCADLTSMSACVADSDNEVECEHVQSE